MSPISEDELRARLRSVEPAPARPGLAEHAIHQGRFRRRRQRWVTGIAAAAAVVTIGGGAFVISDHLGPETALPATPTPTSTQPEVTPTVTGTPLPSPSVTVTNTPSPTTTPSETSTSRPGPDPSTTNPTPSSTPIRSAPPGPIRFLHQGVKGDGGKTSTGWFQAMQFEGPCDSDLWTLAGRRGADDRSALRGFGVQRGAMQEAVFAFPDAADAVAFMGELRKLVRGCEATTNGVWKGVVEDLPGPWGEGIASTSFAYGPERTTFGGNVILAVRSGRGVAMSGSTGPFEETDRVNSGLIQSARPSVEHLYPQLCRYTEEGC